jgi:hypothetical protein
LLVEALAALERLAADQNREPLRAWLDELQPPPGYLLAVGTGDLPTAQRETLRRLGAQPSEVSPGKTPVAVAAAQDDEHELELIAAVPRGMERDTDRRLLIVDAKLRQRRNLYDRLLSQTLGRPNGWAPSRAPCPHVRNRRRTPPGRIPDHCARAKSAAARRSSAIR